MGPEGLEQTDLTGSRTPVLEEGGAKCGANEVDTSLESRPHTSEADPRLTEIIEAWATLTDEKRSLVLVVLRV